MMNTKDIEINPADDPIVAARYSNAEKYAGPEVQQHHGAVGKRKRIYSFSLKEDGDFSLAENQDDEHLIPQSWKDNTYTAAGINNSRNCNEVRHDITRRCVSHACIENCNGKQSVPDATSTPKRKENASTRPKKSLIQTLGTISTVSEAAGAENERRPLIPSNIEFQSGINGSPPGYQILERGPQKLPTYGATHVSKPSTSIIFCVHGNKYGVARCCDDLHGENNEDSANYTHGLEPSYMSQARHTTGSSGSLDHCHTERGSGMDTRARRKLIIASILCLLFMVVEVVGGVLSRSLAIATDAAHLLTDLASFMISLFSIWLASRPSTQRMSFGWHRAEVIGATVSVLMIWVITGILVYAAILRIISADYEIDATIMLITSGVGVGVNIIMGCSLHQHGHSHGGSSSPNVEGGEGNHHGHSHDVNGKEKENINVKAAFIHVIGDFVQSLGVFIAALIIFFKPEWKIVDPICTFIFSVLVLGTTISILRHTMNVLMEGIPHDINFSVAKDTFLTVPGIVTVHNLRIWGLTTDKTALSAHLVIDPSRNAQDILKEASTRIRGKYNIYEMTLQVEEFQDDMDDCTQCQDSPEK